MKFSTIASVLLANAGVSLAAPSPSLTKRAPATAIESITGDNGITTPLPIQPGMVDNCDKFYFVKERDNCLKVSAEFGISFDQFKEWNPTVGDECLNLWADVNVCVHTIGFEYPEIAACYSSKNSIPWGNNKAAALKAANDWCSKGATDNGANGLYNIGETRKTCINAPSGDGKIIFEVYNEWGVRRGLTPTVCNKNLALPINGCPEGGQGRVQSWRTQTIFEKGKC
ncbi:hypothetical protein KAF25_010369 [Fusarium avenaceum]|uniref:LysM domain-containing protein n=1 Tax=Fusarium avenaceum TaxID=40199 RepID=A0A9P7KL07_9HYPO|nr:hypothetical protein KAF25_010369 [Fusarium avenaceum]